MTCALLYLLYDRYILWKQRDFIKINADGTSNTHEVVQEYTLALEKTIKQNPEQYFWFHKRWKTSPKVL